MRRSNNSRPLGIFETHYFNFRTRNKYEFATKAKRRRALGIALLVCFLIFLLLVNTYPTSVKTPLTNNTKNKVANSITSRSSSKPLKAVKYLKKSPIKVGLQVGHWKVKEHPEIKALHKRTGGAANGVTEVDINKAVAEIVKRQLEHHNITVDLLPATISPNYKADVFLSLHADGVSDPRRRGYKSAYFEPLRNDFDKLLQKHLDEAFLASSYLPHDNKNVSSDMYEYYAFNYNKFLHSIAPDTAGLIVEMGYISNAKDVIFLKDLKRPASAITKGVISYLLDQGLLKEKRKSKFN